MSELNRIKTILFTSSSIEEALTRLIDENITYRECTITNGTYHVNGLSFWSTNSARCPLAVFNGESFYDYDDRLSFLACQPETVPAASIPELKAGERPTFTPCSAWVAMGVLALVATEKRLMASIA